MPYIANTDIQTLLNIDLTPQGEALADAIIAGVEGAAEAIANRSWNVTDPQTERFDGNADTFFIKHPPIDPDEAVTVTVDDSALASDEFTVYDDYVRAHYRIGRGFRTVVISYTPSIALPPAVKHALVRWAAEVFTTAAEGGKTAKRQKVGQVEVEYAVSALTAAMPDFVKTVLLLHRKQPV